MMYPKPPMQQVGQPLPAQRPPMMGYGMQPPMQSVGWPPQRPQMNALGMGMQQRPPVYNALMWGRR